MDGTDKTPPDLRARRVYDSPRRRDQAQQTRHQILAAARSEFLTAGYAGTTMAAVATRAGVSGATLEKGFGPKPQLLKQVIDVAIAGDDEAVPVLHRPWAASALGTATVAEFLGTVAQVLAAAQARSARLVLVALEAAGAEPSLRPLAQERLDQRAGTAEWIVAGVLERTGLRADMDRADAVDVVWLLMDPAVFCRLTEDRHWSREKYQAWFADSVVRLLVDSG